jgi:hypothetical protein
LRTGATRDPDRRFRIPGAEEAAQVLDQLDPHRQRQALALVAERYGSNLQPAAKKITPTPSPNNRSEFVAVEQVADLWTC